MSDYDTVLERLVTDPTFVRALSADPDRALVGYALTDDERRILTAGISTDDGRTATVEQRTTKAGLVGVAGLVAELASAMGGSGSGGLLGSEDRIPNFVRTTPQGAGGGLPGGWPGDMFGDDDGDGIPNFIDPTPQGAGGGQPVTGLTGLPGGVADPLDDADGAGDLTVVDPSPQGEGAALPRDGADDLVADDAGAAIRNFT